jgi:hypothetical protein
MISIGHDMKAYATLIVWPKIWMAIVQGAIFYWLTMIIDCFIKSLVILSWIMFYVEIIIKLWPFKGWRLYLIGMIHQSSSKGHHFLLVPTNYFTKWLEIVPLKNMIHKEWIQFIPVLCTSQWTHVESSNKTLIKITKVQGLGLKCRSRLCGHTWSHDMVLQNWLYMNLCVYKKSSTLRLANIWGLLDLSMATSVSLGFSFFDILHVGESSRGKINQEQHMHARFLVIQDLAGVVFWITLPMRLLLQHVKCIVLDVVGTRWCTCVGIQFYTIYIELFYFEKLLCLHVVIFASIKLTRV